MTNATRIAASAAVGGLVLLCTSAITRAQVSAQSAQPVGRIALLAAGSIQGFVLDEKGAPVNGAIVSAFGASTHTATSDRGGRFEMRTLSPGPYLVRAHLSGFVASRPQYVDVRPSSRASSTIALHHIEAQAASSFPVLAAGAGGGSEPMAQPAGDVASTDASGNDDHSEMAWRLRHARRSILKDAKVPEAIIADDTPDPNVFGVGSLLGRAVGSSGRLASGFFTGTPFSGQVNLLTTGSFDTPLQIFTVDSFSRGVAYMSVSAPAGSSADWTVRGALTQGDISSWIVAGSYTTRTPARHNYDIGLSYATQRYDGSSQAALRDAIDGSRNAGAVYGFDTFAITPSISLTYGGRYARYDYLTDRSLVSPRVALTLVPADRTRINALVSSRAVAPGAEEFLPPGDTGIWLPPQRTFSSLASGRPLEAERTTHVEAELERDLGAGATVAFRAFHQHVADQLVTMFDVPTGHPEMELGHYFVGNSGDAHANGWGASVRTAIASRVHASVDYSLARARWTPGPDLAYMILVAPSAVRRGSERLSNVSTSVETEVPETSTRVLVLYRVSNAFSRSSTASGTATGDRPAFDSRFDLQVRQSLPFLNFSTARWEMLLAVHNFFRETAADQSLYDELLVVHPPKRVVGGLTLRF